MSCHRPSRMHWRLFFLRHGGAATGPTTPKWRGNLLGFSACEGTIPANLWIPSPVEAALPGTSAAAVFQPILRYPDGATVR